MIRRSLEPDTKMKIKHWTEEIVLPRLYELQSDLAILFLTFRTLAVTNKCLRRPFFKTAMVGM